MCQLRHELGDDARNLSRMRRRIRAPYVHLSQGHSYRKNLSDITLWLNHFQYGGAVLGVDLLEDYALDLQHRYRLQPLCEIGYNALC